MSSKKLESKNKSRKDATGGTESSLLSDCPGVRHSTQKQSVRAHQTSFDEILYKKQKQEKRSSCIRKKKKRRIKREGAAVGSIICSSVDLQCAADLAGPLIACRCDNMD